jgi:acetyl-CoA/propionyl-CoA/long-chain acyl-CoA carboxylase, biotin carboxylase, biotin carboxyl carrier protein
MFTRVLIANRGEIAVRVARTCHDLGIEVVAVYSDVDANARHVAEADHAVRLPGVSPTETYLHLPAILAAAAETGAEAVHPGYGFLSERAEAAEAVIAAGLAWVGPPPEALRASGDKLQARRLAESAGVAPVPGTLEPVRTAEKVREFGDRFGYPVAIKAAGGGGGRGLRVASSPDDADAAIEGAAREAEAYFGSGDVYLERYLPAPKHVEVQIVSPKPSAAMWIGVRDCSLQRRHQKLVEETPLPRFAELATEIGHAGVRVADACGYVNAGTIEFLLDPSDGRFYFLEINARLQVEHTVTEEVHGLDLVAAQLRIAAGESLGFDASDLRPGGRHSPRGHAIECRINAEDPSRAFLPGPGRLARYREPAGPGVRVDSGFGEGDEIPAAYDSLIAKLVVWGADREEARRRALRALDEFEIEGVPTTIPAHRALLTSPEFVAGAHSTGTVESSVFAGAAAADQADGAAAQPARLTVAGVPVRLWNPAMAGSVASRVAGGDARGAVVAPMHGTILKLLVGPGDAVEAGDPVAVLEAMKMETPIPAPSAGTVADLSVDEGATVEAGQSIARVV